MRLNALIYGLRARTLIIPGENREEYELLYNTLVAETQPVGEIERMQVQQMAVAQWLLARIAHGESEIYQLDVAAERQFSLLRTAGTERTRLERSFYTALHELQRLQDRREAKAEKQPSPPPKPSRPRNPRLRHRNPRQSTSWRRPPVPKRSSASPTPTPVSNLPPGL